MFLQEAYVIADYDRQNFTIAQALFPESADDQNLQAILPPGLTVEHRKDKDTLSAGAIAGIAVGGALVALLLIVAFFTLKRRRQRKRNRDSQMTLVASQMSSPWTDKDEQVFSPFPDHKRFSDQGHFAPQSGLAINLPEIHETDGRPLQSPELDGQDHYRYEIGSDTDPARNRASAHELGDRDVAELEALMARDRSPARDDV